MWKSTYWQMDGSFWKYPRKKAFCSFLLLLFCFEASVSNSYQHSMAWWYATEISAPMILSSKIFESSHGFIIRMPLSRFRTNLTNSVCILSYFYKEAISTRPSSEVLLEEHEIMEKRYSHQHKQAMQVLTSVHEYSRFLSLSQMAP